MGRAYSLHQGDTGEGRSSTGAYNLYNFSPLDKASQDLAVIKQKEALDKQLDELSHQRAMERCHKNTVSEDSV